jgi:hypothetical protein
VDRTDAAAAPMGGIKSLLVARDAAAPALAIGVPLHFGLRLKLHQLPPEATLENVVAALGVPPGMPYAARPIVFRPNTTGDGTLGATIITFENVVDVSRVFNNLSTAGACTLHLALEPLPLPFRQLQHTHALLTFLLRRFGLFTICCKMPTSPTSLHRFFFDGFAIVHCLAPTQTLAHAPRAVGCTHARMCL